MDREKGECHLYIKKGGVQEEKGTNKTRGNKNMDIEEPTFQFKGHFLKFHYVCNCNDTPWPWV